MRVGKLEFVVTNVDNAGGVVSVQALVARPISNKCPVVKSLTFFSAAFAASAPAARHHLAPEATL